MPTKCAYFLCQNKSSGRSFFRFPTTDPNRLKDWINNCGNMTITHLTLEALRNRYICSDHFEKRHILNENGRRQRLSNMAVPMHFRGDDTTETAPHSPVASTSRAQLSPELTVLKPIKVYPGSIKRKAEDMEEENEETFCSTPKKRRRVDQVDTPNCKKIKRILQNTKKILKTERSKHARLKKKLDSKKIIDLNKVKFRSEASKILSFMQLKKTKKPWTEAEKKFCMSLYYKSPAAYNHLRKGGIVLAAPATIQTWLQSSNCLPGLNGDIFENIYNKFENQSIKEKSCAVCFDEMSMKTDFDYTMKYDLIEGFEDFGGGDRSPKEAKYALVFVARGIYSNWKIPLAYFLSQTNVNADKLSQLIKAVINKLFSSGLLPKVVVCDQATTNVKAMKSLGATINEPFFFINDHKLFSIYDVPHLIKSVRNNLIDSNFNLNGNEISFDDIVNVYNIDKNNKSKSLHKLTSAHLRPTNFQKMKVKLATQVLSHSVAAAIQTAMDSGELKSDTAKHTADFVMIVNDLFDSLNSKNQFNRNPYKCALTKNNQSMVFETLMKGREIFGNLKKIKINKKNNVKLTCPPCFDGMQQTINAVIQLSTEEFSKGTEIKFIMTYRLNQDVIENLFGIYRMKGGCNRNPTSKSLRAIFRSNLLNNLIKLDNTNCESDNETFMSTTANLQNTQTPETSCSYSAGHAEREHDTAGPSTSSDATICDDSQTVASEDCAFQDPANNAEAGISLETCSVVYFAGWLGKVCVDKFDCSICKHELINEQVDLLDKKQLLLINKTYSNLITPSLKSPTDVLFNLVNKLIDVFNNKINAMHEMGLVSNLINSAKNTVDLPNDYHDINHLDFLIKKLFLVKIYDYCKSRKSTSESKSKLKILQHN